MRIVGGAWRGRPIQAPAGRGTRPTADRVRQSLFNILEHGTPSVTWPGARVLDVFAGSGALGLEALSRGAAAGVFIERDRNAGRIIQQNAGTFGVAREIVVLPLDATRLAGPPLKAGGPFSVVFLDAPYDCGQTAPALVGLSTRGWLADGAVLSVEVGAKEALQLPPGFEPVDERTYGAGRIVLARWNA